LGVGCFFGPSWVGPRHLPGQSPVCASGVAWRRPLVLRPAPDAPARREDLHGGDPLRDLGVPVSRRVRLRRLALLAALTAGAGFGALVAAPRAASAKLRLAVPEFKIDGEGTPALTLQLQDGFVLGLVRAGVQVLDPMDVSRRLESSPELKGCESSPCLKNLGHLLAVRYVLRVKVDVAGNSYKMVARLFSTEGDAPAALPLATKSRTCDVCTVAEAREYMLRLADALRPDLVDDPVAPAPTVPGPAAEPQTSLLPPLMAAMGGLVSIATGAALLLTMPDCHAPTAGPNRCSDNRLRSAFAGGLIGAGVVTSAVGTTVLIARLRTPAMGPGGAGAVTTTTVALSMRF
jgi:hypothetical protein